MFRKATASIAFLILSVFCLGQADYVREHFQKQEVLIPMRDGVKLFTAIYIPNDPGPNSPFLMMRTPYSCRPYGPDAYRDSLGPEPNFTKERYIFVVQDVRGRYMSEGDFKWMTPYIPNKRSGQVDESTDTWDTIEWLLKNVPNNNGRVGVYGTSFPGHYAAQCLIDPHPALKAVSPQAPMADNWLGDDMHHNGAFFLPHAMGFISGFGKKREGPTQNYGPGVYQMGTRDGYRFYLDMGPIRNSFAQYNMHQIAIWIEWLTHGNYDAYWAAQNVPQHLKNVKGVAVMTVGGWWDAEDLQGPLSIYQGIEKNNPGEINTLVMGPWYHGTWNFGPGDSLYDIKWNTTAGEDFRTKFQKPFFDYYLKDQGPIALPEAAMFDVGSDAWRNFNEWPPKSANETKIYFLPNGRLGIGSLGKLASLVHSIRPTDHGDDYDEYVSDPAKPVPASASIAPGMPRQYMIEDQRFAWQRPDVLSYETEPLKDGVTIVGPVKVTIYVSTTGTDADFIVKLIDVFRNDYPNNSPRNSDRNDVQMGGYQMLIRGEPMRAKFRTSWSNPTPLTPDKVEKVEFVMPDVCYTFRPGHKIMVQVQSTWFPVVDRNPQTFCDIYTATESAFKKATMRVYLSGEQSSSLTVGVLPAGKMMK